MTIAVGGGGHVFNPDVTIATSRAAIAADA
jgi:hypothetical protein